MQQALREYYLPYPLLLGLKYENLNSDVTIIIRACGISLTHLDSIDMFKLF